MKRIIPILFAVLMLLPIQASAQLSDITFIPPMISEEGSFLAIADWSATESVRISWIIYETGAYGNIPLVNDKFVCYFSNTDYRATCGPSPFPLSTTPEYVDPYPMDINVIDEGFQTTGPIANLTQYIEVGGIKLTTNIQPQGNDLYLVVAARGSLPSSLAYSVYKTDLTPVTTDQIMSYDIATDRFTSNLTLDTGEYYIAIWGEAGDGDFGGDLLRVSLGEASAPPGPGVPGSVQAESVIIKGALLTKGADYTQTGFTLTNIGDETVGNLTVSVPGTLSSYLSVSLADDTLDVNDSALFTISLDNIQTSMQINTTADILSAGEVVGIIPISIGISILGGDGQGTTTCPECPSVGSAGNFSITPGTWSGSFLVSEGATHTFTISNTGSLMSSLELHASGDLSGIATADLPDSVYAGGSETVVITVAPYSGGVHTGTLTITSDQGSQAVLAALQFYSDLSGGITSARSGLESLLTAMEPAQAAQLSTITDEIAELIDDAETDSSFGNYKEAEASLKAANAKLDVLTSVAASGITPGPGGGIIPTGGADMTGLIIILLVVAVGAFGGWFYLKKVKKPKKLEEELEEEF